MPGANLTRVEAEERKSIVSAPISYHVQLDLTRDARTFGSTTTICFGAEPGSETFLDLIADNVTEIILNDEALDPAQGRADGGGLVQDIDAIAPVLDHARHALHLTVQAGKPLQDRVSVLLVMRQGGLRTSTSAACAIPSRGIEQV